MTKTNKKPKATRIVTTGNTVRIEQPKSHGRQSHSKVSVIVTPDMLVGGFIGFLREHAIVGLAVGFVVATQVQVVVKQLITSFITPVFSLLFNNDLSRETFTWHFHGRHADFGWGSFVYGMLDFLFVLIVIYAIVKFFKLDKLDKPSS